MELQSRIKINLTILSFFKKNQDTTQSTTTKPMADYPPNKIKTKTDNSHYTQSL